MENAKAGEFYRVKSGKLYRVVWDQNPCSPKVYAVQIQERPEGNREYGPIKHVNRDGLASAESVEYTGHCATRHLK